MTRSTFARLLAAVLTAALAVILTGCATAPSTSVPGDDSRLHVVLFWFKPDAPASERAAMPSEAVATAAKTPGLLACWCSKPAGTPRDVVDNSYDLMIVMRFRDEAAAAAWPTDPGHRALLQRFAPLFAKVVVYDGR